MVIIQKNITKISSTRNIHIEKNDKIYKSYSNDLSHLMRCFFVIERESLLDFNIDFDIEPL